MKNISNMNDINYYSECSPVLGANDISYNLDAHTSSNMKVERPNVSVCAPPKSIPNHKIFSDKEASIKLNNINNDIYINTKKENGNHEFNYKRYLSIFGIFALLAAAITYFYRK